MSSQEEFQLPKCAQPFKSFDEAIRSRRPAVSTAPRRSSLWDSQAKPPFQRCKSPVVFFVGYIWLLFPKIGGKHGKPTKMDGLNNNGSKPELKMDDLGISPLFLETPISKQYSGNIMCALNMLFI